jgi:hypothetical protein
MKRMLKTASMFMILVVDLDKYKFVGCMHDQDSGESRFTTFETTRAELAAVVIIEACLLAGWVCTIFTGRWAVESVTVWCGP